MTRVAVVPLASSLRDRELIQQRTEQYLAALKGVGGFEFSLVGPDEVAPHADVSLILALSGGIETAALEFITRSDDPALILAHPADNAVAAAIEILALCISSGRRGCIVQAVPGWQGQLEERLRMFEARARLRRARLGVVGTRNAEVLEPWRLADEIRRVWGPTLVRITMDELVEMIRGADDSEAEQSAEELVKKAVRVCEADAGTILGAARIYVGLKELVSKYRLDAVTVKCFDLLPILSNTGCYALARLNEDGVPAGCEADVLSTLGMLFLHELTGQPSFMANPSVIDAVSGAIVLAHCTIARTMTTAYSVRSHFESGFGAAIRGEAALGPVTVARLGGPGLRRVFAACGTLVECGSREDMCRTQLTVKFANLEPTRRILADPLGNHHLVVSGDWQEKIEEYVSLFISP